MNLAVFIILLASASAESAVTTTPGYYRGTIGGLAVSACFQEDQAQYYYEPPDQKTAKEKSTESLAAIQAAFDFPEGEFFGKSIELQIIPDRPGIYEEYDDSHFEMPEDFDPQIHHWWEVSKNSKDEIVGTWHYPEDGKSTTLPVNLRLDQQKCEPEYEKRRLALPFLPVNRLLIDGVTVEELEHPVTHVHSVQINSGIPEEAMKKINGEIQKHSSELNERWVACADWAGGITVTFVSATWLQFHEYEGGYCGGPHPNEQGLPRAFDARTGDAVDFEEWIGPEYWDRPKYHQLAHGKLLEILQKQMDEDCRAHFDDESTESWNLLPWMSGTGFEFAFEENDRAYIYCETSYEVPFADMRAFIRKDRLKEFDSLVAVAKTFAAKQPAH